METTRHMYHVIFQTQNPGLAIPYEGMNDFFTFIARLFTNRKCPVYAVGGSMNHVHIIVEIPEKKDYKTMFNKVKSISWSKAAEHLPVDDFCGWLKGYISFSISHRELPYWVDYVEHQDRIHEHKSWAEEKRVILSEYVL